MIKKENYFFDVETVFNQVGAVAAGLGRLSCTTVQHVTIKNYALTVSSGSYQSLFNLFLPTGSAPHT